MSIKNPDEKIPMEVPAEKHQQGYTLGDGKNTPQQNQGNDRARVQQGSGQRNEGEGNRTAAKQYNASVQQSAQNPARTERNAEEAKRAIESPSGDELERAEEIGKKPARH